MESFFSWWGCQWPHGGSKYQPWWECASLEGENNSCSFQIITLTLKWPLPDWALAKCRKRARTRLMSTPWYQGIKGAFCCFKQPENHFLFLILNDWHQWLSQTCLTHHPPHTHTCRHRHTLKRHPSVGGCCSEHQTADTSYWNSWIHCLLFSQRHNMKFKKKKKSVIKIWWLKLPDPTPKKKSESLGLSRRLHVTSQRIRRDRLFRN